MLRTQYLLSFLLFILSFTVKAQTVEIEITDEEAEYFYQAFFEPKDLINAPAPTYFKRQEIDWDYSMPICKSSKEVLFGAIDEVAKTFDFQIDERGNTKQLQMEAFFPMNLKEPNKAIPFKLKDYSITNRKGNKIKLGHGWGYFGYKGEGTRTYHREWMMPTIKHKVKESELLFPLTGSITYEFKFQVGFDTVRLSKEDVGTSFEFNKQKFTLLEMNENKLLLLPESTNHEEVNLDFQILNLDNTGETEITSYSFFELKELQEKDKKYDSANSLAYSKFYISKEIYNYFKANPDADLASFKEEFPIDKLLETSKKSRYLIIIIGAPIEHEVLLYKANKWISKEITIPVYLQE